MDATRNITNWCFEKRVINVPQIHTIRCKKIANGVNASNCIKLQNDALTWINLSQNFNSVF